MPCLHAHFTANISPASTAQGLQIQLCRAVLLRCSLLMRASGLFLQVGSQVRACRIAAQKGATAIVQHGHRSRAPFLAPAPQRAPQAERRRKHPMRVTSQQHGCINPQFSACLQMHLSVGPGLAPLFCGSDQVSALCRRCMPGLAAL